jgi:putative tryptophan/tyrosine transport system substrate-binding protein
MKRREFITLVGGAAVAWPFVAKAQSDRTRRIGVLTGQTESDPEGQARFGAFREGLQRLGWAEDRNLRIDYRWAAGDAGRIRSYAMELVRLSPDAIMVNGTPALAALQQATQTIPIVFAQVSDPVAGGYVSSVARPGGNITGFTDYEYAFAVKWLELLKEIAPRVARVAIVHDSESVLSARFIPYIEAGAAAFGVQTSRAGISDAAGIERSIDAFAGAADGGLIVLAGVVTLLHRERIVALAARHRLPGVYPYRAFAASGGLTSYGVDILALYRGAASYVDRILKGEKPGDLPVQFATKFELVINLKTAKALGLDPPNTLLARTDEIIE